MIDATAFANIIEVVRHVAVMSARRPAYTFITNGLVEEARLDFAGVDRRSRAIAVTLKSLAASGDRALMLYNPGLDLVEAFWGCLYANVIAVPLPPPSGAQKKRYLPRLLSVLDDCDADLVLTTSSIIADMRQIVAESPRLAKKKWIATDQIATEPGESWSYDAEAVPEIAYLQYTSGSTSTPKGVVITHQNVMNLCQYDVALMSLQKASVTVCWMPYFHDYGLIDGVILPLFTGSHSILMAPAAFVQTPAMWLQAISRYRATHSSAPNFAYDLCVRRVAPSEREGLDLSCWRTAANAAEPIRIRTVEEFIALYEPYGFKRASLSPGWGLAEATLIVTNGSGPQYFSVNASELAADRIVPAAPDDPAGRTLIGCGHALPHVHGTVVTIVDPVSLARVEGGQVGEIWVGGGLVARGYWNRPEQTTETFGAYISGTGEGPFLRTGDRGFIRDGQLVFAGRIKDLIIIEGRNHYPQDLELTAEDGHPALRPGCSAAFSIDTETGERAVLVAEVNRGTAIAIEVNEICRAIKRRVAEEHGIRLHDIVLIQPSTIPKTSSGKLQRSACRARYLADELEKFTPPLPGLIARESGEGQVTCP